MPATPSMAQPPHHAPHLLDVSGITRAVFDKLCLRTDFWNQQNLLPNPKTDRLAGKTVITLFYENSTRTRTSFELAAKRMGCDVINITVANSSVAKGENLIDTITTLDAMMPHAIILRHPEDGAPALAAQYARASIINGGDGCNQHPTQALLDAYTIAHHFGSVDGLNITICGDIIHSRVARSNAALLATLGAKVSLAAPEGFCTQPLADELGCQWHQSLDDAIIESDAIMMLRIQRERMAQADMPDIAAYHREFGMTHDRLKQCKKPPVILHPGPMNRGIEISDALASDQTLCLALKQVTHGLAMRQAVLEWLIGHDA